jgi:hypothetical protein
MWPSVNEPLQSNLERGNVSSLMSAAFETYLDEIFFLFSRTRSKNFFFHSNTPFLTFPLIFLTSHNTLGVA